MAPARNFWPVGFRFHPTDEELVNHYLKNKMLGNESLVQYIREVDLCKHEPWELPSLSIDESDNHEWFFFWAQDFKLPSGRCPNGHRTTSSGFWKVQGEPRNVKAWGTNKVIGTKKTLVFHKGRGSKRVRTHWIIHEYQLQQDTKFAYQRPFVVCRLKQKADENDASACNVAQLLNGFVASDSPLQSQVHVLSQANEQSHFDPNIQSSFYSGCDSADAFTVHVNTQQLQPVAEDHDDVLKLVNSFFIDDDSLYENTSNTSSSGYDKQELVQELKRAGFSSDTDTDTDFGWQFDHVSPSLPLDRASSSVQTLYMPKNIESYRSPMSSKRLKSGEERDPYCFEVSQGGSSIRFCEDIPQTNYIPTDSDGSNQGIRTFKAQRRPKSNNLVVHKCSPKVVRLKKEITFDSQQKENDAKHIKVISPSQTSITDSNKNQKITVDHEATKCSMSTRYGDIDSILTTKCFHHSPTAKLVYIVNAFVGIILFLVIIREVVPCGTRH